MRVFKHPVSGAFIKISSVFDFTFSISLGPLYWALIGIWELAAAWLFAVLIGWAGLTLDRDLNRLTLAEIEQQAAIERLDRASADRLGEPYVPQNASAEEEPLMVTLGKVAGLAWLGCGLICIPVRTASLVRRGWRLESINNQPPAA